MVFDLVYTHTLPTPIVIFNCSSFFEPEATHLGPKPPHHPPHALRRPAVFFLSRSRCQSEEVLVKSSYEEKTQTPRRPAWPPQATRSKTITKECHKVIDQPTSVCPPTSNQTSDYCLGKRQMTMLHCGAHASWSFRPRSWSRPTYPDYPGQRPMIRRPWGSVAAQRRHAF